MDGFIFSIIKIIPNWVKPNHLSIIRIFLLIPIVILLYAGQNILAASFFILAVLLDIFDGVLARCRSQITKTGEWLDPFADKILILGILLIYGWSRLPNWLIIAIIIPEILLVLGRPIKVKFGKSTRANKWGKIKMGCQSIAVIGLLSGINLIQPLVISFLLLAIISALLSVFSHLRDILIS